MNKLKIAYVVNSSTFFRSHFVEIASSCKERGLDVIIISGDDVEREFFSKLGFEFICISMSRKGQHFFEELRCLNNLKKALNSEQPDFIHFLTIKPILYGGISCFLSKKLHKKVKIYSVTGLGSFFLSDRALLKFLWVFVEFFYKLIFKNERSKVIFENDDDRNYFLERRLADAKRTYVIDGAGVDTQRFSPTVKERGEEVVVTFVARLLRDKGIREFIEAASILKSRKVAIKMQVVGTVDVNNITSMSSDELQLAIDKGVINYLGFQSDINNIYNLSDIACLPSYREGLPKSLIEAAACGLPIVTTDVPGCRQMVERYDNGVIVAAKDPLALADALEFLSKDKVKMDIMSRNSRRFAVEKLDSSIIIKSFFDVYGVKLY